MQKPSYDMRISDWSSDVCFADLRRPRLEVQRHRLVVDDLVAEPARGAPAYVEALHPVAFPTPEAEGEGTVVEPRLRLIFGDEFLDRGDRKSVVSGKSVSVGLDLGGRRIIKKKKKISKYNYTT